MKSAGLFSVLSTLFVFFTAFCTASSWPELVGKDLNGGLVPRQQQSSSQSSPTSSNSGSASQSGSASVTGGSSSAGGSASGSASRSGSASGTITGSGSATRTLSGSGSSGNSTTKTTAIDPRLPPGGVSMLTPAAIDGMTFVKVGDQVTFGWNYTSLSVAPSYIDVIATNTINSQTYTIAANQSWQSTQAVVWDTGAFAASNSVPFVVATYTLMVYDANTDPTTVPSAGYLGAFSNLQFGVYTPQPYTPLNDFKCATCSGAMSLHEKQALSVLLGTCAVTILSFTWFASGFLSL